MDYIYHYQSFLGGITMASDGKHLIGLWFDGQKYFADSLRGPVQEQSLPVFKDTCRWLDTYFSGKNPGFTPPIAMRTTPFRKQVWDIMLQIPYGRMLTYGEIADKIAKKRGMKKMSAQAVGGAVGHNSISLIIPCHRVIGAGGNLTGYAGGIKTKIKLLNLEGIQLKG